MGYDLTSGAVGKMLRGVELEGPVLQILGFKKIAGQGGADRYRVNISDGVHSHTYAMLATQLNNMVPEGKLESNSIIRVDKMISNAVGEKRVLIILELTIIAKAEDVGHRIGNPVQWTEETAGLSNGSSSAPRTNGTSAAKPMGNGNQGQSRGGNSFYGKSANTSSAPKSASNGNDYHSGPVVPIRDLNPYNSRCAIRARVTTKSDVRTWSNAKGEGKLFNIELLDDSGEVRMTGFNSSVDQFYDLLEVGGVFVFKNFQVKTANRSFNKLPHDYELSMGSETQITLYTEDDASSIPTASYNFVEIAKIEEMNKDDTVDIIGICKSHGELVSFTSRAGKDMTKRDLFLVDKSLREIPVTLWGKLAEDFNDDSQPVIAIKGGKVGDFNGKSLSCSGVSGFQINPDVPEAHALRGWFDNDGRNAESRSLSSGRAGTATAWKVLHESTLADVADSEKGDFFMAKATVMSIKRESAAYQACPAPNCNKKVVDMGEGSYNCEKCSKVYPNFTWRMMLSVNFADFSGSLWATCFQDTAEILLEEKAEIVGPMHKDDPDAFDAIIKNALFRSYIVKFKSKVETFNNETRRKANVVELHPLNFSEYTKKLAAEIKESAF